MKRIGAFVLLSVLAACHEPLIVSPDAEDDAPAADVVVIDDAIAVDASPVVDDATDAPADVTTRCESFDPVDGEAYVHCGPTACALLSVDPMNCGECGRVCPADGAASPWERCVAGTCR